MAATADFLNAHSGGGPAGLGGLGFPETAAEVLEELEDDEELELVAVAGAEFEVLLFDMSAFN